MNTIGALLALVIAGCAAKPPEILGARMPRGCTEDNAASDERCLGWLMDRLWMATSMRRYRDAALTAYITSIGDRLVRAHGDKREWTFAILDDEAENAWAGIGTHVYITRGILARLRDEDELAAVLGHEIGHGFGGHTHAALITSQSWLEKRDDEIQADETGVRLLAEAGYDVAAMPRMLRALAAAEIATSEATANDSESHSGYPSWLERIVRAEIAAAAYASENPSVKRVTGGEERFRRTMASLVVGIDPRDHIIIGRVAVFSKIGIAIDLPAIENQESSDESMNFRVNAPTMHIVDMRLVNRAVSSAMVSSQRDADTATFIVPGRPNAELDLLITVKGPLCTDVLWSLREGVRPIRREELAALHPTLVDLSAPRPLWSPPALTSAR